MPSVACELTTALERRRAELKNEAIEFLSQLEQRGLRRDQLLPELAQRRFDRIRQEIRAVDDRLAELREDAERERQGEQTLEKLGLKGKGTSADVHTRAWAGQVAERLRRDMGGERRAVVSGSIDVPSLVELNVTAIPHPSRLIDLFTNRLGVEGNAFEFYQQTARTNTATAVADNALKPTSTLTVAAVQDRCRVIAHLSEPAPLRLWYDIDAFSSWLSAEMVAGVLDALEHQIIAGDGTGENMTGLLHVAGTTAVPYTTDVVTTLRSAVTQLQVLGENPSGWALHPADAQAIDLMRWGTSGGLLTEGYQTGVAPGNDASSNNIFGPDIKRVVSPSVPQGQAILGDFTKLRIYVRQDAHVDIDASGTLFQHNQFQLRGEGRFGIGVLRPQSFALIDLTP